MSNRNFNYYIAQKREAVFFRKEVLLLFFDFYFVFLYRFSLLFVYECFQKFSSGTWSAIKISLNAVS